MTILRKPVLYATSDFYVNFINDNRETLNNIYLFNLPEKKFLKRLLTKQGQQEIAIANQLLVPQAYDAIRFKSPDESEYKKIKFPCIVKPKDNVSCRLPNNEKNISLQNYRELLDFFEKHSNMTDKTVVHELIPGGEKVIHWCTIYVSKNSDQVATFMAKPIRKFEPDYGVTCLSESNYSEEIFKIINNFFKRIQYTGFADIEFMQDPRDGRYKFIEINPRTSWCNAQATSSGINLPYICYCDLNQITIEIKKQKDGVKWIYFIPDIKRFIKQWPSGTISITEWMKSISDVQSYGCFSKHDPIPFLADILGVLINIITKPIKMMTK